MSKGSRIAIVGAAGNLQGATLVIKPDSLKNALDRGTYKEDYPWSQDHLESTLRRIMGDCGVAYVLVRPTCKLNFSRFTRVPDGDEWSSEPFCGGMSRMYYYEKSEGDPQKACTMRFV